MNTWVKVLTIIVAIETLLIFIYICGEMGFDPNSASVLVSALGVIVTLLVGWQVYNAIESSKIMRRMDTLHSRLSEQSILLETQDQRSRNLIEAFAEERKGNAESVLTAKYMCYLNSIHLFLMANVPPAYQYLSQVELDLSATLQAIEHTNDKTTLQMFIDQQNVFAEIYNGIMVTIHQRQNEWQDLHERMLTYRDEFRRVRDVIIQGLQNQQSK